MSWKEPQNQMQQICTFRISSEHFGVNILLVKEISKLQEITPVPGAEAFNCGLMNLRGHLITVIHPSIFLEGTEPIDVSRDRLLIFKNDESLQNLVEQGLLKSGSLGPDFVGLVISGVTDVIDVEPQRDILPPLPNLPSKVGAVCDGIVRREEHVVTLLNVSKLVELLAH